jgi:hypothetical protein
MGELLTPIEAPHRTQSPIHSLRHEEFQQAPRAPIEKASHVHPSSAVWQTQASQSPHLVRSDATLQNQR